MRRLRSGFRILLVVAACLLGSLAFDAHHEIGTQTNPLEDPRSNPKYGSIANLGIYDESVYPDQVLVREFESARQSYDSYQQSIEYEQSALAHKRDQFLVGLIPLILLFALASCPWEVWIGRAAYDLQVTGGQIGKAIKALQGRIVRDGSSGRIIGYDKLSSYSVADELLKWKKLRDEQVVTEQQFEEARRALLRQDR